MRPLRLPRLRSFVLIVAAALSCVVATRPVGAEIAPDAESTWGVKGQVDSVSNNFEAQVWDFGQIGDVLYAGGKFTEAVSGPGGRVVPRPHLAAFNANTGVLIETFAPDVRGGAVYAVVPSPDGSRLFIAGEFTSVEGQPGTAGLAALNPTTGALDPTWRAGLERPWGDQPPVGRALDVDGDWLYVAGNFTHISAGSTRLQVQRVGRVSLATGVPDSRFRPKVSGGGVWDIDPSPDGSRLYLAGFFTSVNGDTTLGDRFAAVNTADGSLVAGVTPFTPNLESTGRQYAVVATDQRVFVAGEEHMLQVLDATTLTRLEVYFTGSPSWVDSWPLRGGGDFQVMEQVGNRVYAGCHCWRYILDSSTGGQLFPTTAPAEGTWSPIRSVVALDAATGARIPTFGLDVSGTAGAWAIHGASDGCLWVGGDLTQSAGSWLSGMGRWCDATTVVDTERPETPRGVKATASPGAVDLSWLPSSDDVGVTAYRIHRSTGTTLGPVIATSTSLSYRDTTAAAGQAYTYAVTAVDAAGNQSWRSNFVAATGIAGVADTQRPSTPNGLTAVTSAGTVTLNWKPSTDNVGVTSYQVFRSTDGTLGPLLTTVTSTSYVDSAAPAGQTVTYAVKAVDAAGNVSWRSNVVTATG